MVSGEDNSPNIKDENFLFYQALKRLETPAIQKLSHQLKNAISELPGSYLLSKEDIQELINDVILLTLKKIKTGAFQYQNYHPLSYTMAVARRLLSNYLKKRKLQVSELAPNMDFEDFDPDAYFEQKELELKIGAFLQKLGENCEQIIRFKYYDGLKDEEVVNVGSTIYSTIDSLKNKRAQCLKKLREMISENGLSLSNFLNS